MKTKNWILRVAFFILFFGYHIPAFAVEPASQADFELLKIPFPRAGDPPIPRDLVVHQYFELVKAHHPTVVGETPANLAYFQQLTEAYKRILGGQVAPATSFGGFRFGKDGFLNFEFDVDLDSFSIDEVLQKSNQYKAFLDWFIKSHYGFDWQVALFKKSADEEPRMSLTPLKVLAGFWILGGLSISEAYDFSVSSLVPVLVPPTTAYAAASLYRTVRRRQAQEARELLDTLRDDLEYYSFSLTKYQTQSWKRAIFQYDVIEDILERAFPNVKRRPLRTLDCLKDQFQRFPLAGFGFLVRESEGTPFIEQLRKAIVADFQLHPAFWRKAILSSSSEIQSLPPEQQRAIRAVLKQTSSGPLFRWAKFPFLKARDAKNRLCERFLK